MAQTGLGGGFIRNWLGRRRRGAAIPFEAPALRMVRVCEDERDGLIAILRDFANNGAAYIVPWSSLPLVVTMTDHDIAMHKGVGESKPSTPAEVRAVVSGLALSGALGPEAKAREMECAQADDTPSAEVELMLMLHLLTSCGADLQTLTSISGPGRTADAKAAVAAAADVIGVKRQDIYRRVSEFAKLLVPVGVVAAIGPMRPGWLRMLHAEIDAFGHDCSNGVDGGSTEVQAVLGTIGASASRTAELAGAVLGIIDYAVEDIGATTRRWQTEQPVLRQVIDRLSLMLDEWPALIRAVRDALRASPRDAVIQLRGLLAVAREQME